MANTITIRAKAIETIDPNNGHGYPHAVELSGGKFLSYGAALEVAQEAVDTIYGEYGSGWLATLNHDDWDAYRNNDRTRFVFKVVKL